MQIELLSGLRAPVRKGQKVGTVRCILDGVVYAEYPVEAALDVPERDYAFCLLRLCQTLVSAASG